MNKAESGAADPHHDIEVDRDGFVLVLQPQVNPALVVMSMRMANGSLRVLAEILVNPVTRAVIRHEVRGHGSDFPPFRIAAWVDSVKTLLIQSAPNQNRTAAKPFEGPTTGALGPPSN